MADWEAAWDSEEFVGTLVEELIGSAEAQLKAKALTAATVPYTVDILASCIKSAVACHFVDSDAGEPELASASNWAVGAEPVPALIDTWSRGALPAKKPFVHPAEAAAAAGNLSARTPSEAPRTPRSRTPGGSASGGERVPDALPQPDPKAPAVVVKPPPGTVLPKPKKVVPIVTATERRLKRLDAEAREEVRRLEQMKDELKGREYTYDTHGAVIVMEPLSTDKLPAFQQQPRLALSGQAGGVAAPAAAGRGGRKGKGGRGGAKPSGLDFGGNATFTISDSLQPSLLETTTVHPGVRLTQGDGSKGGEPREEPPDRMSKTVFEQVANMSGGFTSRRVGAAPAANGGANPASAAPPSPLGGGGGGGGPPMPSSPRDSSNQPALRPSYMPSSPEPGDLAAARKAPRERGGMPTKNRLPAPPLGATTGHGPGVPYSQGGSLTNSATRSR